MRFLLALAAALSSCSVPGYTLAGPQTLLCVGTGTAEGYPSGKQDRGPVQFRVTVGNGSLDSDFCPQGAKCASSVSAEAIELTVRDVPGYDPVYSASLRIDMRRRTFIRSGGGLDGGWSEKGKCKAVPATATQGRP